MKTELIPRAVALKRLNRAPNARLRNYEIEHALHEETPEVEYVVGEWCPFNGIHCSFWEHADETWLEPALEAHRAEVAAGRMRPHVIDIIQKRLEEVRRAKRAVKDD